MEVVMLLLFVGAVWVLGAVAFFAWNLLTASHEHADRLAFLPLEDNWHDPKSSRGSAQAPSSQGKAEDT